MYSSVFTQPVGYELSANEIGFTSRSPVIDDLLLRQIEKRVARRHRAIVMAHLDLAAAKMQRHRRR